jgi:hypothetical protein
MNWTEFSKEIHMVNKYKKECSISLVIKEMQIETTLRFCLNPVRMAIIIGTLYPCKKIELWNLLKLFYEEGGGWGREIEGMNLIEVYFMHIWKYHNETPLYN